MKPMQICYLNIPGAEPIIQIQTIKTNLLHIKNFYFPHIECTPNQNRKVETVCSDDFWAIQSFVQDKLTSLPDHLLLHASAVEINGKALVVLGYTRAGKSTFVARLVYQGYPLVADDLVVVDVENFTAQSLSKVIMLRKDSFALLQSMHGIDATDFYTIQEDENYFLLPSRTTHNTLPIAGIIVLERDPTDETIVKLTEKKALEAVLLNLYNKNNFYQSVLAVAELTNAIKIHMVSGHKQMSDNIVISLIEELR